MLVLTYLAKLLGIALIVLLVVLIAKLYKVFTDFPEKSEESGVIAFGIIAEAILIIELVIKIITG